MRKPRRPQLLERATFGGFCLRMVCVVICGAILFGIGAGIYQIALQTKKHPTGWSIGFAVAAVAIGVTFLTYRWDPDDDGLGTDRSTTTTSLSGSPESPGRRSDWP